MTDANDLAPWFHFDCRQWGIPLHVGDRTSARDLYYEKVLHNEQNHLGWVGEQAFSKKGPKAESSETFKYLVVNFFVLYYL